MVTVQRHPKSNIKKKKKERDSGRVEETVLLCQVDLYLNGLCSLIHVIKFLKGLMLFICKIKGIVCVSSPADFRTVKAITSY